MERTEHFILRNHNEANPVVYLIDLPCSTWTCGSSKSCVKIFII